MTCTLLQPEFSDIYHISELYSRPDPSHLFPGAGSTTGSWGLSDLSIYITHFYNGFCYCGANVDGFVLRRVLLRANAFAMLGVPLGNPSRGRTANYTQL